MKIVTIVGARPQFIKASTMSRAIVAYNERNHSVVVDQIVHTGQHYDAGLSQVFFDQLEIPPPKYNLGVGSLIHGAQTGRMLERIETVLLKEQPDWVLVYGDTNSTLAGALAAKKLGLATAHVEAGLRSMNLSMPEEINRICTDHIADRLFCPTTTSIENLEREELVHGIELTGDVMYDASLYFLDRANAESHILDELELNAKEYVLATFHRAENTDQEVKLAGILDGLSRVAQHCTVVASLHPRTRQRIEQFGLESRGRGIRFIEPVCFFDMVRLEQSARVICTDSGGVQKEACFYGVPCVTLRDETEWLETVESGWNILVGTDPERIAREVLVEREADAVDAQTFYGDGCAAEKILDCLLEGAL